MKEVIYAPHSFISRDGQLLLDDEHKGIAAKMFDNYRTNQCKFGSGAVPNMVKGKCRGHLLALLGGGSENDLLTQGDILVLTTLHKDLLFSANGHHTPRIIVTTNFTRPKSQNYHI